MRVNPALWGRDYQEFEASLDYMRHCPNQNDPSTYMCPTTHNWGYIQVNRNTQALSPTDGSYSHSKPYKSLKGMQLDNTQTVDHALWPTQVHSHTNHCPEHS